MKRNVSSFSFFVLASILVTSCGRPDAQFGPPHTPASFSMEGYEFQVELPPKMDQTMGKVANPSTTFWRQLRSEPTGLGFGIDVIPTSIAPKTPEEAEKSECGMRSEKALRKVAKDNTIEVVCVDGQSSVSLTIWQPLNAEKTYKCGASMLYSEQIGGVEKTLPKLEELCRKVKFSPKK